MSTDIGKVLAALPSASSSSIELFSCSKSVGSLVSEEDSQSLCFCDCLCHHLTLVSGNVTFRAYRCCKVGGKRTTGYANGYETG